MPPVTRTRLDARLADDGLAASRDRARALVLAGRVRVNGAVVTKAGTPVAADACIEVSEPDFPWVSRGGVKLAHALDTFGIAVTGREALDIGASTGGFTDVLLQRGARRVVALDVGHGQLDWRLREDPRVIVQEHRNARSLEPSWLPGPVDLITIDVSFISLRLILPALPAVLAPGADVVALVKPQFEAGRSEVGRGGLVKDPAVHDAVLARVTEAAAAIGLHRAGLTPSPITGATGNQEFLIHLKMPTAPVPNEGAGFSQRLAGSG
jgi:23S rRNA (cytidine1920-2'-O)/16S rRNA (cytidine1409-2'-O)-methyltransferase